MDKAPVYITDIIGEVVAATETALKAQSGSWLSQNNKSINYVYGSEMHVTQTLLNIKNGGKYPMVALMMPTRTRRGNSDGYYGRVTLPYLYIATLSDNKGLPPAKYRDNFKPVLFPIYYELLNQLPKHSAIVNEGGADAIEHDMLEYPADVTDKANTIFTDFLDIIAIVNLTVLVKQQLLRNCAK